MSFSISKIPKQWKDSITIGFALLAVAGTALSISGNSLGSIIPNQKWWVLLLIAIGIYVVTIIATYLVISCLTRKGIKIKINGITVAIKQGDLFEAEGWKVIPFKEYFDTDADDITISKSSLNGKFLLNNVNDLKKIKKVITADNISSLSQPPAVASVGKQAYTLGTIKRYDEYLLLAFAHFNDQKMAHLNQNDYELCLRNMWKEICRTYANKPVNLPLLGADITRFDDLQEKSKFNLLKCMLCTLKTSGQNINQPITILLTKEVMREINIYELKGVK